MNIQLPETAAPQWTLLVQLDVDGPAETWDAAEGYPVFATKEEADAAGQNMIDDEQSIVIDFKAVETPDPITHCWNNWAGTTLLAEVTPL